MSEMQELVEYIAKGLADRPEAIQVSETSLSSTVLIELDAAAEDKGRLIGSHGRTIDAIRAITEVLGGKLNKKVTVEIL